MSTKSTTAARRAAVGSQRPGPLGELTGRAFFARIAGDAAAVLLLLLLATLTFVLAYGGGWVWVAALGGAVLGVAVGSVGAVFGWRSVVVMAAVIGCYFAFGGPLAMPSTTIAGFIPSGRTLQGLAFGAVGSWKASVTLDPPIGETGSLLVVPLITMLVAGAVAISVALRTKHVGFAWVPPALAGVVGVAFGTATAFQPVPIALGFAVVVLLWTSYRRGRSAQALLRNRSRLQWPTLVLGVVVIAVAAGGVVAVAPFVQPGNVRANLRQAISPPLDVRRYPSPLQGFRAQLAEHKEDVMLTVRGLPVGTRVRIATMDAYDGFAMEVSNSQVPGRDSGTFTRVGAQIRTSSDAPAVPVTIEIGAYSGPWVPTVGETRAISFGGDRGLALGDDFYFNRASGTGINTAGLTQGDTYTLQAVVTERPGDGRIRLARQGRFEVPSADPIPDILRDMAQRWSGSAATTGEAALRLQARLQQGFYSNGIEKTDATSRPGHSYERIQALLTNEAKMIGDEEQYSVAMALMGRHLGVPTRVVYGYEPTGSGDVEIRGKDVSAWTEFYMDGLGWVMFDPTPPKDRKPVVERDPQHTRPRPQVENPPPPPERPDRLPPDNTDPRQPIPQDDSPFQIDWMLVGGVAAAVGIPLIGIVLPISLIVGAKIRRRRARMSADVIANRVAGGWAELTDKARDLGSTPSPYGTRTEQADTITSLFPKVSEGADPQVLARLADTTVFGPETVTAEQASTYWAGVDRAGKGMLASVPLWRRWLSWLSLKSFRRFKSA